MILCRARPRSSVERDHGPPSSETTVLRRARSRSSVERDHALVAVILLSLSVTNPAFFALAASSIARVITSRCRTWSSSRFFFRGCLFARSHSIWLLVARIANSSDYLNLYPKHLPTNPAFITFLGLFGTVMIAETTASNCICATWIRAVS